MPPRLNKRQQRELEELEAAKALEAAAQPAAESDDDEGDEEPVASNKGDVKSAFAALDLGEPEEESEEEEEPEVTVTKAKKKSKNKKKKKNKAVDTVLADATPTSTSSPSTPSKKPAKAEPAAEMDEIDRALAELAAKSGNATPASGAGGDATAPASARLDPKWQAVKDVYAFDQKFLDPDAELRKMFGSKVIQATPSQPRSHHHARFANNPHHATSIKRTASYLAQPEPGWHSPNGVLQIGRYSGPESESDGGEWWTYQHPQQYKEAQLGFLEVLQQADGNRLYNVLQAQPYHVDTLMQLSGMNVQQGDLGASSSYLSKALYALSAPLPPSFTSGSFRLPYGLIENRAFFLGIARKVSILVKRGTWRTACEWAKIALGAGGEADPVGMLCFLDFLGPKAKQNQWFLSLLDALDSAYPGMRIGSYPGLAYAKALVLRQMEQDASQDDSKSTAALKSAILRFPMIPPLLFTALGGNIPQKLLTNRRAQVDGTFTSNPSYMLSLLSEFYVARSSPLWKEPPILAWLQKTAAAVAPSLDDSSLEDARIGEKLFNEGPWPAGVAPAGIIRAAYIAEIPSIRPYLPPSALSGTSYSYDPLPPSRNNPDATFYDDDYFASLYGNNRRRRPRAGYAPTQGGANAAVQAVRNQLAALLGLGGGDGGAQVELNPELREELMAELEQLARAGRGEGELPGGFPGMGGEDEEGEFEDVVDEEEGEGEEEQRQNLFGRLAAFLGGGAPPPQA